MHNYADKIYESVTMSDVLRKYHAEGKRNRTTCPIHNGKDNNFCYTDKVYHCWVCGAKGNVIKFIMQVFNLDFNAAIFKLNYDFALGLPIGERLTHRQKQQMREEERERRTRLAALKKEREKWNFIYSVAFDELVRLQHNKRDYAPKSPNDELHPLYVEALKKLDYQEYVTEIFDERRASVG